MATLARRLSRLALFIGLLLLSIRYVHTYPDPMPAGQQHILWKISRWLGVRDPDDVYIPAMAVIELIVAIVVYRAIMKLWRYFRRAAYRQDEHAPSGPKH
ncbi:hypothetical protein [Paraburkholderia antibiotica]|uniref:Uncharacterized protein n=1 Tax=Paraburkholderia antibiotica TaxID=2728839 RepID=A0A7X9ZZU8_9BURK|nr:hypothetical protein [Paraburkholderia antibiotica]NML33683.1 hypothetical protein [Paraburkholderia antibiotica]